MILQLCIKVVTQVQNTKMFLLYMFVALTGKPPHQQALQLQHYIGITAALE